MKLWNYLNKIFIHSDTVSPTESAPKKLAPTISKSPTCRNWEIDFGSTPRFCKKSKNRFIYDFVTKIVYFYKVPAVLPHLCLCHHVVWGNLFPAQLLFQVSFKNLNLNIP